MVTAGYLIAFDFRRLQPLACKSRPLSSCAFKGLPGKKTCPEYTLLSLLNCSVLCLLFIGLHQRDRSVVLFGASLPSESADTDRGLLGHRPQASARQPGW